MLSYQVRMSEQERIDAFQIFEFLINSCQQKRKVGDRLVLMCLFGGFTLLTGMHEKYKE